MSHEGLPLSVYRLEACNTRYVDIRNPHATNRGWGPVRVKLHCTRFTTVFICACYTSRIAGWCQVVDTQPLVEFRTRIACHLHSKEKGFVHFAILY